MITQITIQTKVALYVLRKPQPYKRCIITITITDVQNKKNPLQPYLCRKVSVLKEEIPV